MKPIFKTGTNFFREAIQWILRIILICVGFILWYKIYPINPFFVKIFDGTLLVLVVFISEEKLTFIDNSIVYKRLFFLNLIKKDKKIEIKNVKNFIVAGHFNRSINLKDFILPYYESNYNEIRFVFNNDKVEVFRTAIYIDDLNDFERKVKELINNQ